MEEIIHNLKAKKYIEVERKLVRKSLTFNSRLY